MIFDKNLKLSNDLNLFDSEAKTIIFNAIKAEENVIRLFPPLIVQNEELDEAIKKIEKVCKEMS